MNLLAEIALCVMLVAIVLLIGLTLLGGNYRRPPPVDSAGLRAARRTIAVGLLRAQIRRNVQQARRDLEQEIENLNREE